MSEELSADDDLLERFVLAYSSAQERSARYWRQWTTALPSLSREVVEGLAQTVSDERRIPLEQAQAIVAAEKVAGDMGAPWVAEWLAEHDERQKKRELSAGRLFQPMNLRRKR